MKSPLLIEHLHAKGIRDHRVLEAMTKVPRELFVTEEYKKQAYENEALPIQCGQTISQPYVVARMTELLLSGNSLYKVLEVGTGSGYQAAILSQLVNEVYTIERHRLLLEQAEQRFSQLELTNIYSMHGDGYLGWPDRAPFDGIIVTAATPEIPSNLREQLKNGGRMVIPLGVPFETQEICLVTRHGSRFDVQLYDTVVFVPMVHGKADE